MEAEVIKAIISGLVGGVFTGIAAWAAIRVEIKYLRRDVDYLLFGTDRRSASE
ncbi:MAG: hypothetical protein OQL08_01540 [Gammaproteobacteria bacterium]|nr:hypothetical protein [Gammaproteobacteria bacterium]